MVLTLDPRNRLYYARGGLILFEECCKQKLRRGDWRALSSNEFAAIRQQLEGRPYAPLQWLCAYLDDVAAQEPDDFLRYRVLQNIDLQGCYPSAARIAQILLGGATLKAAAAATGTSLADAKRVAAAFDAVGLLVPE